MLSGAVHPVVISVFWGSAVGHTWKRAPDPEYGLKFVNAYVKFVMDAQPKIWIMENVDRMKQFYREKPRIESALIKGKKRHAFWGNFPLFLMPQEPCFKLSVGLHKGKHESKDIARKKGRKVMAVNAKIPLSCSLAFAKACKTELEKSGVYAPKRF